VSDFHQRWIVARGVAETNARQRIVIAIGLDEKLLERRAGRHQAHDPLGSLVVGLFRDDDTISILAETDHTESLIALHGFPPFGLSGWRAHIQIICRLRFAPVYRENSVGDLPTRQLLPECASPLAFFRHNVAARCQPRPAAWEMASEMC
jgi:hypothetical protein